MCSNLLCSSYQLLATTVCIGALPSWKAPSLSGNDAWTIGWTWSLRMFMQLDSSENITCFYWSADQPLWFLHHFNLFGMLIVESRDFLMVALPWYPALLSSQRTVLIETGLFICWFNSAVTLAAIVRCFLSTMRFNARWSLSVSLEAKPELIWLLEFFPGFLNFVMVLDMLALEKRSSVQLLWWMRMLTYELKQSAHFQTQLGYAFLLKCQWIWKRITVK